MDNTKPEDKNEKNADGSLKGFYVIFTLGLSDSPRFEVMIWKNF
jgi:hypothetical protein